MNTSAERYLTRLDELNKLIIVSYYQTEGQSLEQRKRQVKDDFLSFLIEAYLLGIESTSEQLGGLAVVNSAEMNRIIYLRIKGETFEDRIDTHLEAEDLPALERLAESEYHRVFNDSAYQQALRLAPGGGYARWNTMGDYKVRDTHDYIDGVKVPIGQEFFTYDGDHAHFPGGFEKAENNVSCRCWITYTRD